MSTYISITQKHQPSFQGSQSLEALSTITFLIADKALHAYLLFLIYTPFGKFLFLFWYCAAFDWMFFSWSLSSLSEFHVKTHEDIACSKKVSGSSLANNQHYYFFFWQPIQFWNQFYKNNKYKYRSINLYNLPMLYISTKNTSNFMSYMKTPRPKSHKPPKEIIINKKNKYIYRGEDK